MKYLLYCFFLLPCCLGAQCYGSFEVFGAHGVSNVSNSFLNGLDLNDSPVSVSRFGFGASFRLGQRTYLRTSVQFSQYGSQIPTSELRWGTEHDGDGGFNPDTSSPNGAPTSINYVSRHLYVEGALTFRYQFKTWSNWQPFLEGGAAIGKYGTTASVNKEFGGSNGDTTVRSASNVRDFRSLALIGRVGAGTNYNFSERVGVYAMVVGQRHLTNLVRVNTARVHPWQATLEVGVRVFMDPR